MRGFRKKNVGIPPRLVPPSAPQAPPPYTLLLGSNKGSNKSAKHRFHMYVNNGATTAAPSPSSECGGGDPDARAGSRAGPLTIPTGAGDADPLSVHAAVVGLVAAVSRARGDVDELDVRPEGKTAALRGLGAELAYFEATALRLLKHLRRVELGTLPLPARAALLDVDVLVAVLTAAVMTIAELDGRLEDMVRDAHALGVPPADVCHLFARPLAKDANRIGMLDYVVTELLSVLQVNEAQAIRHRAQAQESVMDMLQADIALAARMATLDDPFAARAAVPAARIAELDARPPPPYSVRSPSSTAELPDYAAAVADLDGSVTIRPSTWSLFSGLHLADFHGQVRRVPVPVTHQEIRCGAEFYAPGFADHVYDALAELAERDTKNKTKPLLQVLGLSEPGDDASSSQAGFMRRIATRYGPARLT